MAMKAEMLLPGESEITSKGANFVLKLDEHGLPRFRYDGAMGAVGMAGKEAIGGHLHVTNFRVFFQSHSVNRFKGSFSIFLPSIEDMKDASAFLTKKMEIVTPSYNFEFVVWGIPQLMAQIKAARGALSPEQQTQAQAAAQAEPGKNWATDSKCSRC